MLISDPRPLQVCAMLCWRPGLLLVSLACAVQGFYLPGLAPVTYCENEDMKTCTKEIKLFVNKLNSEETVIPYEYHQ